MLRVGGGGLVEIDAELKFAKIQNSHVRWGGGGGWWNQLSTFDTESKFAKQKFFCEFFRFSEQIGTDLFWTLSTKWLAYTKYRRLWIHVNSATWLNLQTWIIVNYQAWRFFTLADLRWQRTLINRRRHFVARSVFRLCRTALWQGYHIAKRLESTGRTPF